MESFAGLTLLEQSMEKSRPKSIVKTSGGPEGWQLLGPIVLVATSNTQEQPQGHQSQAKKQQEGASWESAGVCSIARRTRQGEGRARCGAG